MPYDLRADDQRLLERVGHFFTERLWQEERQRASDERHAAEYDRR